MDRAIRRGLSDRGRLMVGLAGPLGAGLGVCMFFFPGGLATATGYSGVDHYGAQLGGSAMLGFPVALLFGLQGRSWAPIRFVVLGLGVTGAAGVLACLYEAIGGHATATIYMIMLGAVVVAGLCAYLISAHGLAGQGTPDMAQWVLWLTLVGVAASAVFGLGPLIAPSFLAKLIGL